MCVLCCVAAVPVHMYFARYYHNFMCMYLC